jgi:Ran GTPase-activating protein (RanGAP) involved in mRNA processing and transport
LVDIRRCIDVTHGLLTAVLEQSIAPIDVLKLQFTFEENGVASAIQRGLAKNKIKVHKMEVWASHLSASVMFHVFEGICKNETLEAVNFGKCSFQHGAADEIAKGLQKASRIRQLGLWSSRLGDTDLATIIKSCGNLMHIDLGHNSCGSKTMTALGNLCTTPSPTLRSLNLSYQLISCIDVAPLAKGLIRNTSLKQLDLRTTHINDTGVESMVECLRRNRSLETLILTDCSLSRCSMNLMLENIAHFKVKCVRMDGCHSLGFYERPAMIQTAFEALQKSNVTLEALYLPPFFDLHQHKLNNLLDLNLGGRRLLHQHDDVRELEQIRTPALWPIVLYRINTVHLPGSSRQSHRQQAMRRANMMYFMLRQRLLLEI